jgi:glycerol uptake facilitator-like aquaporin
METIVTCIFVSVILGVKYHNGANELILNAGCIGMTLYAMASISGGTTGGCLNPAVGISQTVF